jgi:hypothetical protein
MSELSGRRKRRVPIIVLSLAVAVCLWWLFRPELLVINKRVNETAPAAIAEIQPLFTGSLHAVGNAPETSGRVNVLKKGNSLQLVILNLESKAATSFTVSLAPSTDKASQSKPLGQVTVAGHQAFVIPHDLDLTIDKTVLLMDSSQKILAVTSLEAF